MRAKAITTAADFRLQESADQPLQSTLTTVFDAISHHDRHHGHRWQDVEARMHEPGIRRANGAFVHPSAAAEGCY
jgi:hypothetical protein